MRTVLVCVRTPLAAQTRRVRSGPARVAGVVRTAVSEPEAMFRLAERPAEVVLADTAVTRPDSVGLHPACARPRAAGQSCSSAPRTPRWPPPRSPPAPAAHPGRRPGPGQRRRQGPAAALPRPAGRHGARSAGPAGGAAAVGRRTPGRTRMQAGGPGAGVSPRWPRPNAALVPAQRGDVGPRRTPATPGEVDAATGRRSAPGARDGRPAARAHRARAAGAARHGRRQEQRRDRARAVRLRGHREDPRPAAVPQARRPRPGARGGRGFRAGLVA